MLHIHLLRQYEGAPYVPERIHLLLPKCQEQLEMAPSWLFLGVNKDVVSFHAIDTTSLAKPDLRFPDCVLPGAAKRRRWRRRSWPCV